MIKSFKLQVIPSVLISSFIFIKKIACRWVADRQGVKNEKVLGLFVGIHI